MLVRIYVVIVYMDRHIANTLILNTTNNDIHIIKNLYQKVERKKNKKIISLVHVNLGE